MIPGRVENWIILGQIGDNEIFLPFADIRKIVSVL
jgi:hypothetical protein